MSALSESVRGSSSFSRDSEFFIDVKPLYLRAERTVFCVPRHYFQTSDVFDGMFTLPDVPNAPQEGSSEENPLFLESIKADELREFLRVLSSRRVLFSTSSAVSVPVPLPVIHPPTAVNDREADDDRRPLAVCRFATSTSTTIRSITPSWLPVLKLASLWQFTGLRQKALQYLKSESCMTRLEISRQYDVESWFLPALRDLVNRNQPLGADEIKRLGLEFAVKVVALREAARGDLKVPRQVVRLSFRLVGVSFRVVSVLLRGEWRLSA
ncbi:hypothetical protein GSI_04770 [Ganoderma sinense ZZ0214-1]|uniref:BTB domain-containing protein n=1 Tax=Ganoderma sinense ZZ0214-1 TaxID=1077348 RepID=A0A2G8SHS4_9APHY|nr:hypothetical protein GSI_04770 [Ganoderma sinense ZZ0214-1]